MVLMELQERKESEVHLEIKENKEFKE